MSHSVSLNLDPERVVAKRDPKIFGHFLEHFHRQIYGGIFDPGNARSDENGFRTDVIEALRRIRTPVVRWPGGCFVSAYHWKDGVGTERTPAFDKAWRVEEPHTFGTDEFVRYCRALEAEPFICTNAGSGTPEEMSDWVEYCNLANEGRWARRRIANGHRQPHNVRYWSIGNENYLPSEIGAKRTFEWGDYVRESAKMMKRVDPSIELSAAGVNDLDWNIELLRRAGKYLDWISIHGYWDMLHTVHRDPAPYEQCMVYSTRIGERIDAIRYILGALGYLGRIRVAFDEWNLRGWHHPAVDTGLTSEEYLLPRDRNDDNATYTTADAVFSACFLNECLRNADLIGMANFAPVVSTRGAIFTHPEGIVLRSTFHVFEQYSSRLGETVVDSWSPEIPSFRVDGWDGAADIPVIDAVATVHSAAATGDRRTVSMAIVNRHPAETVNVEIRAPGRTLEFVGASAITAASKDSFNDIDHPDDVTARSVESMQSDRDRTVSVGLAPHSVTVVDMSAGS